MWTYVVIHEHGVSATLYVRILTISPIHERMPVE